MATSYTSILLDQWEREQKGGGGTGQCIGVAKKRWQGCAPTGLSPVSKSLSLIAVCFVSPCLRGFTDSPIIGCQPSASGEAPPTPLSQSRS